MEITCYRGEEIVREQRILPAAVYNRAVTLLARSSTNALFVPIRSMQYMAILDEQEFVFVDGVRKCWVDIAWRQFYPQARTSLTDPVEYEVVYYRAGGDTLMARLQAEFPRALQELAKATHVGGPAQVLQFAGRNVSGCGA
ncbi:MAG: hypothetical protein V4443_02195 [Pseudomonadota bacterium]